MARILLLSSFLLMLSFNYFILECNTVAIFQLPQNVPPELLDNLFKEAAEIVLDRQYDISDLELDESYYDVPIERQTLNEFSVQSIEMPGGVDKHKGFIFTAGKRVNGDDVIVKAVKYLPYKEKQDVSIQFKYPTGNNVGRKISYIYMHVYENSQNKSTAHAEIMSGGIGQCEATVNILVNATNYVTYNTTWYGY